MLCKLLFRLEIKGLENLPIDRPFIICPNHCSYLDGVALAMINRRLSRKFVGLFGADYFQRKSFPLIVV